METAAVIAAELVAEQSYFPNWPLEMVLIFYRGLLYETDHVAAILCLLLKHFSPSVLQTHSRASGATPHDLYFHASGSYQYQQEEQGKEDLLCVSINWNYWSSESALATPVCFEGCRNGYDANSVMECYQNAAVNWCSQILVFTYLSLHIPWAGLVWKTVSVQVRVYLEESPKNKLTALHVVFFLH